MTYEELLGFYADLVDNDNGFEILINGQWVKGNPELVPTPRNNACSFRVCEAASYISLNAAVGTNLDMVFWDEGEEAEESRIGKLTAIIDGQYIMNGYKYGYDYCTFRLNHWNSWFGSASSKLSNPIPEGFDYEIRRRDETIETQPRVVPSVGNPELDIIGIKILGLKEGWKYK